MTPRSINDRILLVWLAGISALGLLWLRCLWVQVLWAERYSAATQHTVTTTRLARRGAMLDRSGRPLAVSVPAPSIFANPRVVTSRAQLAERLASAIGDRPSAVARRLDRDRAFVWITRQIEPEALPSILPLASWGVGVREEHTRLYPQGRLASHVVGIVDIDQRGLEGLELSRNGILKGADGWHTTLRDARGDLLVGPWTTTVDPRDGYDLVLTIDSVVQRVAEETLEWGVTTYHAQGGSIVVLEPFTGAVLAMANRPAYDPDRPAADPSAHRRNRAVTDLFEPGSIFKIVTAAALLEEGKVRPEETFFCEQGSYPTVGGHILHDHKPHGTLSFRQVISLSSNIGTAKAAQRLTPEELYRYIRAFGFGEPTGIDYPGEIRGIAHPPARWSKLTPFILPVGQEVAATPLQLAVMTAVVANGGQRVTPYLVDRVQTASGEVIRQRSLTPPVRVISRQTAETLHSILADVVVSGTGRLANVQGLTVAGKTGTAQKLEPTGRYSHSRYVASFVGFGPVPDPRFVIVVSVDEPRPAYFGGVVAAPMFRKVIERLVSYWGLERAPQPRMAKAVAG